MELHRRSVRSHVHEASEEDDTSRESVVLDELAKPERCKARELDE